MPGIVCIAQIGKDSKGTELRTLYGLCLHYRNYGKYLPAFGRNPSSHALYGRFACIRSF